MILPELLKLIENLPKEEQRALCSELRKKPIKRKHLRRHIGKEIGYVVNGKEHVDIMRDLSFEGTFLETSNRFNLGQVIQLEIPMGNSPRIIRTTGIVVRVTNEGIGIKLTKDRKYNYDDAS